MSRCRLSPRARAGLVRLADRVEEQFGNAVAQPVVHDLLDAIRRLASASGIGHRRQDLTQDPAILF